MVHQPALSGDHFRYRPLYGAAEPYPFQIVSVTATSFVDPSKSRTAVVTLMPAVTGTAQFVTLDSATQGNWHGVYGADGYNLISDAVSYPGDVGVTPSGYTVWSTPATAGDQRALSERLQHEPDRGGLVRRIVFPD